MNHKIYFKLCTEDIQYVAEETLGRKLSKEELKQIEEELDSGILEWFEPISNLIREHFKE